MSTQAARLTSCLLLALVVTVLPLAAGAGETPGGDTDDRARADRLCEEADRLAEQGDDEDAQARWEEALDIYRELGLTGEQADVLCRRGARLRELRRYGEAQTCFETAIAIKPDCWQALDGWGKALLLWAKTTSGDEAERLLRLSLEKSAAAHRIDPWQGAYNAACAAALLGEEDECRKWLDRLHEVGTPPSRQSLSDDPDLESVRDADWFRAYGPLPVRGNSTQYFGGELRWQSGPTPAQEFSPASSEIVFHSEESWPPTRADILKSNIDGSDEVNLTEAAGIAGVNCRPTWSPDGTMIAFNHCDPVEGLLPCKAGFHAWVMKADGSDARPLRPEGSGPSPWPKWAPDGAHLVVRPTDPQDSENLVSVVVDLSGTEVHQLRPGERGPCCPNDRPLAFVDQQRGEVEGRAGWWSRLIIEDPDGTNRRTAVEQFITDADLEARYPTQEQLASAPDNDWLADVRMWAGPYSAINSPDNSRIAFLAALPFDPEGADYREQVEVWVYDLATEELTRVTHDDVRQHGLAWLEAELGDAREAMDTHLQLGYVLHHERDDLRAALKNYEAAAKIAREHNWPADEAHLLEQMADAAAHMGDHERAVGLYREAVSAYRSLGLWEQEMNAVFALFWTLVDEGDLRGMEACLERARELHEGFRGENRPAAADALSSLGEAAGALSRHEEAASYQQQALAMYEQLGLRREVMNARLSLGHTLRRQANNRAAMEQFEMAAEIARQQDWPEEEGEILAWIGETATDMGDHARATDLYQQVVTIYQRSATERDGSTAALLDGLGRLAERLSKYEEAMRYLGEAAAVYEELGHSRGAMNAHQHLGFTLQERGDVPGALRQYEAAAAIAREQSWPQDEVNHLAHMAGAAGVIGDRESVVSSHREAIEICQRHRLLKQEVLHTCELAGALRGKGEPKEADGALERARQLCHELRPERDRAEALGWLAGQEQAFSQDDQAREHREEALAIYQDLGLRHEEARTLCGIGSRLAELGEYEEAQPILQRALAMYRELGLERSVDAGEVLSALATAASTSFRRDEAIDYFEQALAMFQGLGDSRSAMHTRRRLGFTLWTWQHYPEASEQLQEAAAIAGQHSWPKWEAQTLADMASWAVQREDHTRAANLLREAVAIQRKAGMLMEELHTTCSLASVLRKMGKESEGEACLERARALCREVPAERDLAEALRVLAGEELGFSQDDQARQHREQAIAIYQELGLKEGEAGALWGTGSMLIQAGRFSEAQEFLEQSLAIYSEVENEEAQAGVLNHLGHVAFRLGRYEQASSCIGQSIAIYDELGQRETPACALWLVNQGLVMIHLGDHETAVGFLEEAGAIYQKLGIRAPLAGIHLGLAASRVGEYDRAQEHLEKALASARELGDRHAEGRALGMLSRRAIGVGQHRQGLDYAEKAVSVFSRHGPKFREADQLSALGSAAAALGDYDKAWGCFEQAIEIYRKRRFDHAVFSIQLEQAQLRMHQLRLPEARSILDRAGEPLRWGSEHVPAWHLAWGRYYLLNDEANEAVKRFEQAGAAAGADASQLTASHIGLGLAREALGEWEQAVTAYGRAVELSEDSRSRTPTGERVHFFGARAVCFRRLEAYEGLVRVLHRMDKDEEAFFWSEHGKARVLVEAMARGNHGSRLGLPAALRKQEQDLSNRIAALSSRAREDERSREQLQRVSAEHKALVTRLRRDYPEYASMQYPLPLQADEMSLGPNEVLLAYEVTEPESYLFLVRDGEVEHVYEIKLSRSELTGLVGRFRRSFAQVRSAGDLRAFDVAAAEQLYDLLLRPALADIEADEHVLVVPDEAIALVPLEALVVHSDGSSRWRATRWGPAPRGVEYVGDTRVFAYWHSGTTMTTVRRLRKEVPGDQVLLVADLVPVAREDGTHPVLQTGEGQRVASSAGAAGKCRPAEPDGALSRSPGIAGITDSLRRAYGGQLRLMPGMEATGTTLQQEPLQQYAIIVFAMHGVLSDSSSGRGEPALVLSQADGGPDENTYLTMTDVMDLDLRAEIVALIACETGAGELARGEGIMAMSRAFQYAGARSVLVSLWNVEDESSDLLAQTFFEGVAAGRPKLEALQAAHRRLRQSGYEHPFFWAAFVLMGEDALTSTPHRRAGHLASMPHS